MSSWEKGTVKRLFCVTVLILLLMTISFLTFNIQPVRAEPRTWTVDDDGPADFHTIGEAVAAAGKGDTIYVRNGTYNEHVAIYSKTDLRMFGEDRSNTIIDGNGYGPVVTIANGFNVTFANFTVRNAGWTSWETDNGVRLWQTQLSQVTDCIVSGCAYGIREMSMYSLVGRNVINGNTVSDCTEVAIGSSNERSIGNIVANNTITNSTNGIYFNNPYNIQILGNHIFGTESQHSQYGIHLQVGGLNNTIIGNRIEYSDNAIRLDYADSNVVEENAVKNCTYGVFVGYESSDNIVVGNNASGSSIGFMLWDKSNDNLVTNNLASNNGYGIALLSSNSNKIYHNNFISNNQQVLNLDGQPNVWDDDYPLGGNYWSDYAGVDANGDGVGDTPYVIDADNQDRYPLMNPYLPYHDIALANVTLSKTIVGEGYKMVINGDIENQGDCIETFDITLYANSTIIGTFALNQWAKVRSGFPFIWNTTGFAKGYYNISAYISPVGGESDTDDNAFTGGWVFVTVAGDVRGFGGTVDGTCDMRDIGAICGKFMTPPSGPDWDPNMDINGDDRVDMRDIGIACSNFGKT